ncbi:lipoprotein [Actinorhabdospora filicis]|uniref:Lipoprotein n=1 Tax=Actinorhabdospora filicis TaxID=1785913 RepID=A0A9W6SPC1_9ACTN|nr:DUF4097 family beta strand repeat-containing protein [Actinorhabdospora filicis]GLZ80534.1 lipoprotein [Actinorhabdospora filicis]
MSERNPDPSSRVIILIGLVVLGLLIAGGVVAWGLSHGFGPQKKETQSQTYTDAVTAIDIHSDSGEVTIKAGAEGEIKVERTLHWYNTKPKVDEKFEGTTFKVYDDQNCNCGIDYVITVPKSVSAKLDIDSGDLSIEGVTGAVDVTADSGNVTLEDLPGALTINASSGDIRGDRLSGATATVTASSGSVNLTFTTAPSSLDLNVDSGDVDVTVPNVAEGYKTNVKADSGDVDTDGLTKNDSSARSITIDVDSGNVTVKS